MLKFAIPSTSIGRLIGPKGKNIAQTIETYGLKNINVDDDGIVVLDSDSQTKNEEAMKAICK
jgi:polyribonucleotide nucleotidyltransferase